MTSVEAATGRKRARKIKLLAYQTKRVRFIITQFYSYSGHCVKASFIPELLDEFPSLERLVGQTKSMLIRLLWCSAKENRKQEAGVGTDDTMFFPLFLPPAL